ncbi:MAG: hypothetical protein ACQEWU_07510 [Bacillota bacterium]
MRFWNRDTYTVEEKATEVIYIRSKSLNNKTRYLIHPDLMFRLYNDGTDTKHIRTLFQQHED